MASRTEANTIWADVRLAVWWLSCPIHLQRGVRLLRTTSVIDKGRYLHEDFYNIWTCKPWTVRSFMLLYVVHCKWELYCQVLTISIRYMTMYDAFLPAASQAMVRFRFFIHHKKNSMLVWWFPQDTSPSWLECPATHDTLVKVRGKKRTGFCFGCLFKSYYPPLSSSKVLTT